MLKAKRAANKALKRRLLVLANTVNRSASRLLPNAIYVQDGA